MEIVLAGASAYKIEGWTGQVEVRPFKLYQYKRIANARNQASLFRKLVKTFKGNESPIDLPEGFEPKNLLLNDFLQILVAVWACHERGVDKVFTCPHCNKLNPRHVDLLKVFIPEVPKVLGGQSILEILGKVLDPSLPATKETIECKPTTVGNYLEVHEYIDNLYTIIKEEDLLTKVMPELKKRFGKAYDFQDQEDIDDFRSLLFDFGILAISTEYQKKSFDEVIIWLLQMDASDLDLYKKIDQAVEDVQPKLIDTYNEKCKNCNKEFEVKLNPAEYFFGGR